MMAAGGHSSFITVPVPSLATGNFKGGQHLVNVVSCEQVESFDDFLDLDKDLDLDLDLDLDMDMDVSEDFGIEVVGGNIAEIIISDEESKVSPLKGMLCRCGVEWSRRYR